MDWGARPARSEINFLEPESDHTAHSCSEWSKKATGRQVMCHADRAHGL